MEGQASLIYEEPKAHEREDSGKRGLILVAVAVALVFFFL